MKFLTALRTELGQLSYSLKARKTPQQWRDQYAAIRGIRIFNTPSIHYRGPRTEVWGIAMVKDEIDILPSVIDHMFQQGVHRLLIADNLSHDGTREYIRERSNHDSRIIYAEDNYIPYVQSEKMTWLAHLAWRYGARWVIPFDADEFWYAPSDTLAKFLQTCQSSVIYAGFHHSVPVTENPSDVINTELVMDTADSFPGKVAFRAHPFAVVVRGNHEVCRLGAHERSLEIVHVQYRGAAQIARKVRQGAASAVSTGRDATVVTPHWLAGSKLSDSEIQEVWTNISHGLPDDRIQFKAEGPMARGKFLRWRSWNEDGSLNKFSSDASGNAGGSS